MQCYLVIIDPPDPERLISTLRLDKRLNRGMRLFSPRERDMGPIGGLEGNHDNPKIKPDTIDGLSHGAPQVVHKSISMISTLLTRPSPEGVRGRK